MNCCRETAKMGVPARHAGPPGNRLKAKPMADGQSEEGGPPGRRLQSADCGFEIAQNQVRQCRQWKLNLHSSFTQIISLHQAPFNLKSEILKWSQQVINEISGLGLDYISLTTSVNSSSVHD
jgi:excinuclease UvrABC ATPase subunit